MSSTTSSPQNASANNSAAPPPRYACQRCTNCCRWPGFVKLTDPDITAISEFLQLPETDFIQRYTRLRPNRDGLALIDQPDESCIFLEGQDCRIQPVKPHQCRGFPNTWNFPGWREVCQAIELPHPSPQLPRTNESATPITKKKPNREKLAPEKKAV
jgi:Fe-S-cluster containining protein